MSGDGLKVLSDIIDTQPEEPLLLRHVCKEQFLSVFTYLGISLFCLHFWQVNFFLEKVLVDNFHFYSSEDVIPLPPTSIVSDATSAVNRVSLGLPCPCHFCLAAFWIFSLSFAIIVFIIIYLAIDSDTLVLFGVFKFCTYGGMFFIKFGKFTYSFFDQTFPLLFLLLFMLPPSFYSLLTPCWLVCFSVPELLCGSFFFMFLYWFFIWGNIVSISTLSTQGPMYFFEYTLNVGYIFWFDCF